MLELNNIIKTYTKGQERIEVLLGVNLKITAGEFLAVQGASGSGKTTLLLIAGGLLHPDEGQVFFGEENLYSKNSAARADLRSKYFGFVFQQYHLVPYLTTLENILLPALVRPRPEDRRMALNLIDEFGLSHRVAHFPSELSAGEKQRTALARALLHAPSILFADEITGNLDEPNSIIVMNVLKKFAADGGSVILVSHNINHAQSADRIVTINNAQII